MKTNQCERIGKTVENLAMLENNLNNKKFKRRSITVNKKVSVFIFLLQFILLTFFNSRVYYYLDKFICFLVGFTEFTIIYRKFIIVFANQ